jgi:flagellar protein FlaF
MGFGTAFVTLAFVLIVTMCTYMFVTGSIFTMDTLSNSLNALSEKQNDRLKTEIELGDVSVTNNSDYNIITLAINNTGATKILKSDFVHIDVFVYYHCYIAGNTTIHKWVPYTAGALNDNEWTVVDIAPDLINPGTFDPGETMNIRVRVSPAITEDRVNWLKVVMPNAVLASKYFSS